MKRLTGAISAWARRDRHRRLRTARLEIRRLRREVTRLDSLLDRARDELRDARLTADETTERAEAAEAENARLRGELDIFAARDALWIAWEARERARVDAETARHAARRARALDRPTDVVED